MHLAPVQEAILMIAVRPRPPRSRAITSRTLKIAAVAAVVLVGGAGVALAAGGDDGRVGPSTGLTPNGRALEPAGRLTSVGNFPTGGAVSPDGRFYWAVDSGHGHDDVTIVNLSTGKVVQSLPLPGGYGGVAFSPDGTHAYVSGEPKGTGTPAGPTKANAGDAIHVYDVDTDHGTATEATPIQLPHAQPGNAQSANSKEDWPEGLAVTPDGKTLVVALNQVDRAAVIDLATNSVKLVPVGEFPAWVAISPDGKDAYVSNEYDGTVSTIDLASDAVTATIPVGGPGPNPDGQADAAKNAHPEGLVADPHSNKLYVAIANRDLVAVIDRATQAVTGYVSVGRDGDLGTEPVSVALSPDGSRLYSADSGEDAIAVIDTASQKLVGRIPTAAYPTAVSATATGNRLVWLSGKGLGAGPNPQYGEHWANSNAAPYGSYVLDMLDGVVGTMQQPNATQLAALTAKADREVVPANHEAAPDGTPIRPDGPIKHVFYIVRENRTYDQVLGSDKRGDGDPSLELADDNGVSGPSGGVTPNLHALTRQFPLIDHFYADSEVSQDGHKITSSGIGPDFVERDQHPQYSGRGRNISNDASPVASPPRDYLFDQAIRQGISFRNYGEYAAGTSVNDGRPTYGASVAGKDATYPGMFGCDRTPANAANCDYDHGTVGTGADQTAANSRFDTFENEFTQQLATNSVPAFNYLILPNDHTNGTAVGKPTPRALLADNDYGLGQIVQVISHSSIWKSSAIFVVEDDSQDGGDHVDAHRMPALAISPYARHGAVVHTRYDQDSAIRTMELILGMKPLALTDALATPMYDAFTGTPDLSTYTAIKPDYPMDALNGPNAADAKLSAAMPFNEPDAVPQQVMDRILWHSVYGENATPPAPGPNASADEQQRAVTAMRAYRAHRNVAKALGTGRGDDTLDH
jgi:YVTN family beta-propeller protein